MNNLILYLILFASAANAQDIDYKKIASLYTYTFNKIKMIDYYNSINYYPYDKSEALSIINNLYVDTVPSCEIEEVNIGTNIKCANIFKIKCNNQFILTNDLILLQSNSIYWLGINRNKYYKLYGYDVYTDTLFNIFAKDIGVSIDNNEKALTWARLYYSIYGYKEDIYLISDIKNFKNIFNYVNNKKDIYHPRKVKYCNIPKEVMAKVTEPIVKYTDDKYEIELTYVWSHYSNNIVKTKIVVDKYGAVIKKSEDIIYTF